MAIGSVIGLSTRLTSGIRADRRGSGHLKVVWQMLLIGSITYVGLAMSEPIWFYVAAPVAFASAWGWPALFHLSIVRRNPGAPAAATGITQTGTLIGALAGPLLLGGLAEAVSYRAMWLVAGACSLAAAATIAYGRRLLLEGAA
jgi:MFS family permease